MMLWIRARHFWAMPIALVSMVALDGLFGHLALTVPALFGGGSNVVFAHIYLPLIWAAVIADSFSARRLSTEWRPMPMGTLRTSRLALCDAMLFAGTTAVASALFAAASRSGWARMSPVLVLAGVSCIGAVGSGAAIGAFASTMLMLATSVYPRTAPASRFVHILQPDGEPSWSAFCGVLACSVAVGVLLTNAAHSNAKARHRVDA